MSGAHPRVESNELQTTTQEDDPMRASKNGIEVSKAELNALLTFAGGKEGLDSVYFGIKHRGDRLVASATDGHRALEITTDADSADHVIGEWAVARAFLEACGSILDSEGVCILLVTAGGLRKARIMDVESLAERATVSWHEEAASTQMTIGKLTDVIRLARFNVAHSGTWFALQGRYLAEMLVVSKACGKAPITIYPPPNQMAPMYFEATSDGAQWRGCVMPCVVREPGGPLGDDDEQPDDIATAREILQRAADDLGADVTVSSFDADGKKTGSTTVKATKPTSEDPIVDDDYVPEGAEPPLKTQKKTAKKAAAKAKAAPPKKNKPVKKTPSKGRKK